MENNSSTEYETLLAEIANATSLADFWGYK
jgi:hypothetical protein